MESHETPKFNLFESSAAGAAISRRLPPGVQAIVAVLLTWLPILLLAWTEGRLIGPTLAHSALHDAALHVRYLVTLPLLLLLPSLCGPQVRTIVAHFVDAELVRRDDRARYLAEVADTSRRSASRLVSVAAVVVAIAASAIVIKLALPALPDTWRSVDADGARTPSRAGWWMLAVAQPLFVAVLIDFLFRLALWWRFCWRIARLDLDLSAGHPDGAGGLGFLGAILNVLAWPTVAISAGLAGGMADRMLMAGTKLADLRLVIAASALLLVTLMLVPLLFFTPQLARAKRAALFEYSVLCGRQLHAFRARWLVKRPDGAGEGAAELGSGDFSAVADLAATAATVQAMRVVPCRRGDFITLVAAALIAYLPVMLIELPLKETLKSLAGFLL